MEWKRGTYRLFMGNDPAVEVDGIVMDTIGIHFLHVYSVDVTHLPSGKRIAGFSSLGAAMEFAERVTHLIDWMPEQPVMSADEIFAIEAIRRTMEASAFRPRTV